MSAPSDPRYDAVYAREVSDLTTLERGNAVLPEAASVVVVGGGFTGLSAAFHLARGGIDVALIEAGALGDGASGRNGGQVHPGQRRTQRWLAKVMGEPAADALWSVAEEAITLNEALRAEFGPMGWRPGLIDAAHTKADFDDMVAEHRHLGGHYGVEDDVLDAKALADAIGTKRYHGGVRTMRGGHLNPLALVTALARGSIEAGAKLVTGTRVQSAVRNGGDFRVATSDGECRADAVLIAGNGMMTGAGIAPFLRRRVVPLRNYLVATEPLEPIIVGGEAVSDTRTVVRYFRQDGAGRMIFGGGETFGRRSPADIAAFVRPYLAEVYPQLANAKIAAAWGGTLGITRDRTPIVRQLEPGLYAAVGYSGQGVAMATFAGKVIADAILGDASRLAAFAALPNDPFPGGVWLHRPLAVLGMAYASLQDRIRLPRFGAPG